jgi:hypothetical protein
MLPMTRRNENLDFVACVLKRNTHEREIRVEKTRRIDSSLFLAFFNV